MAKVVVSLRIMPKSPDINLDEVEKQAKEKIAGFAGEGETKTTVEPVAFGLKSVNIIFVMEESIGSTESLEKEIEEIEGVNSIEVTDVRRAIG